MVSMLAVLVPAAPAQATVSAITINYPASDNKTLVRPGGNVYVGYTLDGSTGSNTNINFQIYSATLGTICNATQLISENTTGQTYPALTVNVTATEGLYNVLLTRSDNTSVTATKTGSVYVDTTAPTGSLLIPTVSTVWKGGSTQSIYWTSTDAADTTQNVYVTLDFYNGTTWNNIFTSQPYAQGQQFFSWNPVTSVDSTACQIRMNLTDKAGNTTSTPILSPTFTVLSTPPTVAVTYPDAASISWTSGAGAFITWDTTGSAATTLNYLLQYSINSGTPITIATLNNRTKVASDNYSSFTAPYVPYLHHDKIKVIVTATDAAGNTGNDTSSNDFIINSTTAPSVTLGAPNGGQNWLAGSNQNITFTMTDLSGDNLDYQVQYTTNASGGTPIWYVVTGGTLSDQPQGAKTVPWVVPTPTATSTDCKVRVKVTNKYSVASDWKVSTSAFTITVSDIPPVVAVITPNGGETLVGGTGYNITYTATDSVPGTFRYLILQSIIGGTTENITVINYAPQAASGSGSFVWSVPNSTSPNCRVQVIAISQTGQQSQDQSDNLFEITTSAFAPQTTPVILYPGWNLISLPLIPVNSNIGSVMAAVSENISYVWYYDTTNGWQSWTPGAPSDLTIMRDGKAYWVKTNQPTGATHNTTLSVYGRVGPEPPDVMPTYTVASGWNMVGFKSLAPQTASVYLAPLTPTSIYLYDNGGGTGYQRVLTSANLSTGMGYWVYFGTGGSFAP